MNKSTIYICSFLFFVIFVFADRIYSQNVSLSGELNKKLSTADLISDFDFILNKIYIKEYNRSPFNFILEEDFKTQVKKVKEYFLAHDSLSRVEFYKKAGPLITLLKDDHSSLKIGGKWMYDKLNNKPTSERFVFPLSTLVYKGDCFVIASDTIPIKSKIISINDIPVLEIIKEVLKCTNSSEYNALSKNIITSFDFLKYAVELWGLYSFSDAAKIRYIPYGQNTEKEITVSLYQYVDKTMTKNWKIMPVKMEKNPSLEFKKDIAILRLPSFRTGNNIRVDLIKSLDFFEKKFNEINSANPKKLLIDISNNGGGSEDVGYILLNYLYDRKLKSSLDSKEFTPIEYFNENIVPIIGDSLRTNWKFNKYKGGIYLLISEMTFSSAVRFADLFKTFSIGKIIGRETRGFRTHYGEVKSYSLEKTGMDFILSSKFFISASGDMKPHGVIPDYEMNINNVDDLLARFGNDYLLQEAIKYISN